MDAPSERPSQPAPQYAGFRQRVWAWLIDDLFLIVPTLVIWTLTGFDFIPHEIDDVSHHVPLSSTAITAAFWWLYYALLESSRRQASLGKLATGIKVTDLDGRRISFGAATMRAWPFYLFGLTAIVDYAFASGLFKFVGAIIAFVACIAVAFSARKQGIHDMMAGCLVVR